MSGILTLAIIKPHAYISKHSGKIISRIEEEGFGILQSKITQFQQGGAEDFYAEHKGKPFFPNLIRTMSSAPIWVLVLSKSDAVQEWRSLIGNTNPAEAAPGTIRHDFGDHSNVTNNAVHGSASDHDAKREINFFFARELKIAQRVYEISEQSHQVETRIRGALASPD